MAKGKFRNELEEKVYGLSLDGVDDDCGDVETGGWAGFIKMSPVDMAMTGSDMAFAIITEDQQGSVEVTFYEEQVVAELWWSQLVETMDRADDPPEIFDWVNFNNDKD